ncbi:MAG: serine hydrolase [Parvularculaceae bacterium]|nr:serine hydrolase [Parvularculaceae bacterium]
MSILRYVIVAAASCAFLPPASAADPAPEQIEAQTRKAIDDFQITGLAITVVKGDSIIFQDVYGVRDVRTDAPIDENTIFPIASISKAFTTAALAMLVDEGKLEWDDPVRRFIPEFEMSDPYITAEFSVRDLVTHRSGLPPGAGDLLVVPDADPEISDILAALKHIPPSTSFRSQYAYDNLLYIIAGEVLSRIDAKPWSKSIKARIFKPLGLKTCEATPSLAAASKNTVTQHLRKPGSWTAEPIDPRYIIGDNSAPAGGLSCSISDLAKWAQFWLNGATTASGKKLLSDEQVKEVWTGVTPQSVNPLMANLGSAHLSLYGLGWSLHDFHGRLLVSHSGGVLGGSSYFGLLPEEDIGVFVTSNLSNFGASALALQVLSEAAAPDADSDWIGALYQYFQNFQETAQKDSGDADKVDAAIGEAGVSDAQITPVRPLGDYVGTYIDPWYGAVSIEIRNGALFIDMSRSEILDAPLIPVAPDKFLARWADRSLNADAYVNFSGGKEAITGMTMQAVSETTDFSFDFKDLDFKKRD